MSEDKKPKWSWMKEPDRKPPENPLIVQQEPQNAGGSASRKEDVRDDLSDIRKFQDAEKHKHKFPLGEQP